MNLPLDYYDCKAGVKRRKRKQKVWKVKWNGLKANGEVMAGLWIVV